MRKNKEDFEIICECPFCGSVDSVWVNEKDGKAWENNELLAQDAFPYLNSTKREMIISGMCPSCQKKLFGEQGVKIMKITDTRRSEPIPFEDIEHGQVFLDNEGTYWLKFISITGGCNAVDLDEGTTVRWDDSEEVYPVEAELIIK